MGSLRAELTVAGVTSPYLLRLLFGRRRLALGSRFLESLQRRRRLLTQTLALLQLVAQLHDLLLQKTTKHRRRCYFQPIRAA